MWPCFEHLCESKVCFRQAVLWPPGRRMPLRRLSDTELLRAHRAAKTSLDSFSRVTRLHGSLIQSWVAGASVVALEC